MNTITKLATLCMALFLSFGIMSACGGNTSTESSSPAVSSEASSESSSTEAAPATAYSIQLVDANGAPVSGYAIQLCKGTAACYAPCFTDANGMVSYNKAPAPDAYDIHVWSSDMMQEYNYTGDHTTPAEYNTEAIVLVLGEAK